jgi:hypothetical protein
MLRLPNLRNPGAKSGCAHRREGTSCPPPISQQNSPGEFDDQCRSLQSGHPGFWLRPKISRIGVFDLCDRSRGFSIAHRAEVQSRFHNRIEAAAIGARPAAFDLVGGIRLPLLQPEKRTADRDRKGRAFDAGGMSLGFNNRVVQVDPV